LVEAKTGFHQARPNPFRENITISFYAENTSVVSVVVYDLTGRKVSTLLNRRLNRGIHEISWDGKTSAGSRAPSGIYMYSIQTRLNNRTGKIILK
jgi:flagellar hook assembly protein FlgD